MTTNFTAFEKARIHEGANYREQAGVHIRATDKHPALIRIGASYFSENQAAVGRVVRVRKSCAYAK